MALCDGPAPGLIASIAACFALGRGSQGPSGAGGSRAGKRGTGRVGDGHERRRGGLGAERGCVSTAIDALDHDEKLETMKFSDCSLKQKTGIMSGTNSSETTMTRRRSSKWSERTRKEGGGRLGAVGSVIFSLAWAF